MRLASIFVTCVYFGGGIISLIFGICIFMCARINADHMAHEKGLRLAHKLKYVEQKYLKTTDLKLRAGLCGAWIEIGNLKSLCN